MALFKWMEKYIFKNVSARNKDKKASHNFAAPEVSFAVGITWLQMAIVQDDQDGAYNCNQRELACIERVFNNVRGFTFSFPTFFLHCFAFSLGALVC